MITVVGGGLFGCYATLLAANQGNQVTLVEQDSELLSRASSINQARLHTGFHYPRSLLTARESLANYRRFRRSFPDAVRDFEQIYAISKYNSLTSASDMSGFIERLGIPTTEVEASRWFNPGTVEAAYLVEEPTFDAAVLRRALKEQLMEHPNVALKMRSRVSSGIVTGGEVSLKLDEGRTLTSSRVIIATYASTNATRQSLGLDPLPLEFELAEVILGKVTAPLKNRGFTVMDGPFWSLMPFGHSSYVTLTSVGMTPVRRSGTGGDFPCQRIRKDCTAKQLQPCTTCASRPRSTYRHQRQQMAAYLKMADAFTPSKSLLTVKTILKSTRVDDARPTMVLSELQGKVVTVLSGKISTLFDLEEVLR